MRLLCFDRLAKPTDVVKTNSPERGIAAEIESGPFIITGASGQTIRASLTRESLNNWAFGTQMLSTAARMRDASQFATTFAAVLPSFP